VYSSPNLDSQLEDAAKQLQCSDNSWLLEALERWFLQGFPHWRVNEVLHLLILSPHPIPQFTLLDNADIVTSAEQPSMACCIRSLEAYADPAARRTIHCDLIDSVTHSPHVDIAEFVENFRNHHESTRSFSALSIPVTAAHCEAPDSLFQLVLTPPRQPHGAMFTLEDSRPNSVVNAFDCAYTMPGSYSGVHLDFYLPHQLFIHVTGAKIWFTWPLNQHNRTLARHYILTGFGSIDGASIPWAIRNLTGMTVHYIHKPMSVFELTPSMLHAAITLERACHLGTMMYSLETLSQSLEILDYWINSMKNIGKCDPPALVPELTGHEIRESEAATDIANSLAHLAIFVSRQPNTTASRNLRKDVRSRVVQFLDILDIYQMTALSDAVLTHTTRRTKEILKSVRQNCWRWK
jgi:hypothetical protein